MDRDQLSRRIQSALGLDVDPVGIAFVTTPPAGVRAFDGMVPSTCAMWREAEKGVFYAPAESHFNCAVGSLVMGFELPEKVHANLMGAVGSMVENGYLAEHEPSAIPSVTKAKSGIVYGPLSEFPVEPDLVLMWLSPRQAMIFSEAAGNADWASTGDGKTLGRPACAALPAALNGSRPVLSLGCTGMRTFTQIAEDRLLAVVPGTEAAEVVASLESTAESNRKMQQIYDGQLASLTGG
jgi:uncharacterized protein (DUF169 family)